MQFKNVVKVLYLEHTIRGERIVRLSLDLNILSGNSQHINNKEGSQVKTIRMCMKYKKSKVNVSWGRHRNGVGDKIYWKILDRKNLWDTK